MADLIGRLPSAPPDLPGVAVSSEADAARLGLPLVLGRFEGQLGIKASSGPERPLTVDFSAGRQGYRLAGERVRHERLVKAVGGPASEGAEILDLTAGLGRDALVLAQAGYRVVMLERAPVIHALLADGLSRLATEAAELASGLTLIHADARAWLATRQARYHAVLIDPLFPERQKSAAVKKDLQWLQQLAVAPDAAEEQALLDLARRHALKRVVVKRPLRAPPLARVPPAFDLTGRTVRFDVYLPV